VIAIKNNMNNKSVNGMYHVVNPNSLRRALSSTTLISLIPPHLSMNKFFQRLKDTSVAAGTLALGFASSAHAQLDDTDMPGGLIEGDPIAIVIEVVEAVLSILALAAVIVIIIAGIRLILSQGEDEQKDKAKKTIFYALAGLVIVLLARVIVGFVTDFLLASA